MFRNGLEAVVAGGRAVFAKTNLSEGQVKIIADDEDVAGGDFIEMSESLSWNAGIVVEALGFEEDVVLGFEPNGIIFVFLPS